jgi:hypothetical protein
MSSKRIMIAVDKRKIPDLALVNAVSLSKVQQAKLFIIFVIQEFLVLVSDLMLLGKFKELVKMDALFIIKKSQRFTQNEGIAAEMARFVKLLFSLFVPKKKSHNDA